MNRAELIENYTGLLGLWKDNIEKTRKEKGVSTDEPMFINVSVVTDLLKYIVKDLTESENERPKGEWIKTSKERVMCNKCTFIHENWFANFNYCPNCGAEMGESEED